MNSRSGFSLVSVLVATVVMGILALGFSQIMSDSFRGARSVSNLSKNVSTANLLRIVLSKPSICKNAFFTGATNNPVLPSTLNATAVSKISANGPLGDSLLPASTTINLAPLNPNITLDALANEYVFNIELTFVNTNGVGPATHTEKIPIAVKLASSPGPAAILECSTIGLSPQLPTGSPNTPTGSPCGRNDTYNYWPVISCFGHDPEIDCPPGYTQGKIFGSNSDNQGWTCWRN